MAQVAVTGAGAVARTLSTSSSGTTYFGAFGGAIFVYDIETTEADAQWKNRGAATLQNMNVNVSANARATSTALTSRHNTAAGNQAITIAASATGVSSDVTHTDALADGDLYNYQAVMGASSQALAVASIGAQLAASSGQCFRQLGTGAQGQKSAIQPSTAYVPLGGASPVATTPTEAATQIPALEGATLSNLQASFASGTATTIAITLRKGGVNGNQAVITATANVLVEDTTHTDSVVSGNLLDTVWGWTSGARGVGILAVKYLGSTTNQVPIYTVGIGAAGTSSTQYWPLDGDLASNGTEANVQYALASGGSANTLTVNITANTIASSQNFLFRHNGANGNQIVAIAAFATGVFADATHTDTCVTSDLIDCSTPSTFTSSASLASFGILYATAAPTTIIALDSKVLAEFDQGLTGDRAGVVESGNDLIADANARAESGAVLFADDGARPEFSGSTLCDAAPPAETRGALIADRPVTVEARIGLMSDGSVPLESLGAATTSITADAVGLVEWATALEADAVAPSEWGLAVRLDSQTRMEALGLVIADSTARAEFLSNLIAHGLIPTEWITSLLADGRARAEFRTAIITDSAARFEALVGIAADRDGPLEWVAGSTAAYDVAQVEWIVGVQTDALGVAEFLALIETDRRAPTDSLTRIFSDAATLVEWLALPRLRRAVIFMRGLRGN